MDAKSSPSLEGAENKNSLFVQIESYWDARPCNVRHSGKAIGTVDYFREVSHRRYLVEPHILDFMETERWTGKHVLELGCGIGTDGARFTESGAVYSAIELSKNSLDIAKKRFEVFGLAGNFFHVSMEELDLTRLGLSTPNLVYCFGVLHHTVDPQLALNGIVSQCSAGTEFRFMLYAKNSYKAALIEAGLDQYEAQDNCPIAYTYSKDEAFNLFKKAGLNEIEIEQDHIFQYEVSEYRDFRYKKVPWFEVMPDPILDALKKNFGWHLLIKAKKTNL